MANRVNVPNAQKVFDGMNGKRGPQVERTKIDESNADRSRRLNFIRSIK